MTDASWSEKRRFAGRDTRPRRAGHPETGQAGVPPRLTAPYGLPWAGTKARGFSPELWLERYFALKCLLIYLLLAGIKSRVILPEGRFWAEEGAIFYTSLCAAPGLSGLGFLFNDHLELWTNLGVLLSTLVPLERAPAVTTHFALALQMLPLVLVVLHRASLGLSRTAVLLVLLVATGMPQAREVWGNTINLHFHFALVAALVLALPTGGRYWRWLGPALLALSGLSGIPANVLAPLFVLVAIVEKDRTRALQALVLSATALLQIWFLLHSGYDGNRTEAIRPDVILLASLTQSFFTQIFSPVAGQIAADLLRPLVRPDDGGLLAGGLFLVATLVAVARIFGPVARFDLRQAEGWRSLRLVAAAALLLSASITLAIGDPTNHVSSSYGSRYFFAPNLLLVLVLVAGLRQARPERALAVLCLAGVSAIGVPFFYAGPGWSDTLAAAPLPLDRETAAVPLAIWPYGWEMQLPAACLAQDMAP